MELNHEVIHTPVRDAATVVMLRDGVQGLEVFLIKRHGLSEVLGGAYVFPGGKVDAADAEVDMAAHLDTAPATLRTVLAEPALDLSAAGSIYVAAAREAFEEAGVLFAQGAGPALAARATALSREGHNFAAVMRALELRLSASALVPWSRWITPMRPAIMSRRFDTRFFVAGVPGGQLATHDNHEATESVWLTPRIALAQYWERQIELAPPQIMSLSHLARHATVASVLALARSRTPPIIRPESFELDGMRVLCYPGDERHPDQKRALPGPTRLYYRNKRFEPAGGLGALLA